VHLADGIVSPAPLMLGLNLAGAVAVAVALRSVFSGSSRAVAWTGTLAGFVLAAQALNVPLVPGASAHVVGTGLLALALGPGRAIIALTAVLLVQALLLADGGITVLGVNVIHLAVLPALAVHALRRLLGESPRALVVAAVAGTALGNVLGAASLATLLVFEAGAPLLLGYGWLVGVQALAGILEGVLTALAVRSLIGRAPGLLRAQSCGPRPLDVDVEGHTGSRRGLRLAAVAVLAALALLPFASSTPDALEVVLEHLGTP
jgi:cobalt/nickel transport system permease protein